MTEIRPALPTDAEEMTEVQNAIHRAGLRASRVEADWVVVSSPHPWQRHGPAG